MNAGNKFFAIAILSLSAALSSARGVDSVASTMERLKIDPKDFTCIRSCTDHYRYRHGEIPLDYVNDCRQYCDSRVDFHLFFGNGVLTNLRSAKASLKASHSGFISEMSAKQPELLEQLEVKPRLAFNPTNGIVADLAISAFQRFTAVEGEMFFYFLKHVEKAPSWFRPLLENKLGEWIDTNHQANVIYHSAAQKMLKDYYDALSGPRPGIVMVVTHSQGNLFLSHIAALLRKELAKDKTSVFVYEDTEDTPGALNVPHMTAVQTALPIERSRDVNNALRHGIDDESDLTNDLPYYFTLESDGFMKALRPLAPPPTIDNETGGLFEHYFLDHYLQGKNSGPAIRRAMVLEACNTYVRLFGEDDDEFGWGFVRTDDGGNYLY